MFFIMELYIHTHLPQVILMIMQNVLGYVIAECKL